MECFRSEAVKWVTRLFLLAFLVSSFCLLAWPFAQRSPAALETVDPTILIDHTNDVSPPELAAAGGATRTAHPPALEPHGTALPVPAGTGNLMHQHIIGVPGTSSPTVSGNAAASAPAAAALAASPTAHPSVRPDPSTTHVPSLDAQPSATGTARPSAVATSSPLQSTPHIAQLGKPLGTTGAASSQLPKPSPVSSGVPRLHPNSPIWRLASNATWNERAALFRNITLCWGRRGRWVRDASLLSEPYFRDSPPCYGLNSTQRDQELGYRWDPNAACTQWPFERFGKMGDRVGRLLQCHPILIAGDSLSVATTNTVRRSIQYTVPAETFRAMNQSITFVRNDLVLANLESFIDRERFDSWVSLLPSVKPDIVLLNRGTHFRNDSMVIQGYTEAFDAIKRLRPDALVLVRSSPAGHAKCWLKRNLPPVEPEKMGTPPAVYNWHRLAAQDVVVERLVQDRSHVFFMDVTAATRLRHDSHYSGKKDCLHYCQPGPIDMWADMLANMVVLADALRLFASSCAA